ncbi:MAG: hypothetical protein IPG68_13280 [Micrococcales bacterium]|nr:hypothetical protein [Micrococcales bacterium]
MDRHRAGRADPDPADPAGGALRPTHRCDGPAEPGLGCPASPAPARDRRRLGCHPVGRSLAARPPRPRIYLRQTDIPGVHTKIMEQHKRVLGDLVPGRATAGPGWFERRYGFLTAPATVRFRVLDDALCLLPGVRDMALPAPDFLRLCPPAHTVFVTENLTNFLAFPPAPDALVVFGAGNEAPELLAGLSARRVVYTGDLDTHGLAILDRFRAHLPHTQSILMDLATLQAHREMWVSEKTQITRELPQLLPDEQALYDALRQNVYGDHVRLEQERIRFSEVRDEVARVAGTT